MAYDFPNSPTVGQQYQGYTWDGQKWTSPATSGSGMGALVPNVIVFTASGTYTPTPGMVFADVEARGSGAGGGSVNQSVGGSGAGAGGGGQGSLARSTLTAATIGAGQTITIGAAGLGGATTSNNGGAGGDCSFGALVVAKGGSGGGYTDPAVINGAGGVGGVPGTGQFTEVGWSGGGGNSVGSATGGSVNVLSGFGGGAGGGSSVAVGAGIAATGLGAGGSGGARSSTSTGSFAGGNGKSGYVKVTEYGYFAGPSQIGGITRSYLAGLTLSTAGSSATFSVAPGQAADSTNVAMMSSSASISKTTAAWAAGSGNGALDTGAIAANTWYHVHQIERLDTGGVDFALSLSASGPTLGANIPAAYTLSRRIGSMRTNASSQWVLFHQLGDEFLWDAPVADASSAPFTTAASLVTLTVPTGVQVNALFNLRGDFATNTSVLWVSPLDLPDITPLYPSSETLVVVASSATVAMVPVNIRTSTSAQVRTRANATGPTYGIGTIGWIDRRGRDA